MTTIHTKRHFDTIAHRYDESIPLHVLEHYLLKRTRFLKELVGSGRALDVGCGTGVLDGRLQREGFDVVGIDDSLGMLSHHPRKDRTLACSSSNIPFRDNSFDLVFSIATFHHLASPEDVKRTIAEMVRVAKKGGHHRHLGPQSS